MTKLSKKQQFVTEKIKNFSKNSPWVLRVTEQSDYEGPVLIIKERTVSLEGRSKLKEVGFMYNGKLDFCRNAIRMVVSHVVDENGENLELESLLDEKMVFRGNIPLDETAGAKIALLFILQAKVLDKERVEMMAWRIERFTREEVLYWLAKVQIPIYGKKGISWAKTGLREMLAGRAEDKEEVLMILETIRR